MTERGGGLDIRPPSAVLLDLDGTLVDNSGVVSAVRHTCAEVASRFVLDEEGLLAANAAVFGSYFQSVESDWALGRLSGHAVELETWRRALHLIGCDDERAVDFAAAFFSEASRGAVRMFPDARELLSALPSSMAVGVVTNGAADSQWQKLRAVGLVDRVDAVVISAELGVMKPDPEIFAAALRRLNVEPASAWHVGDSASTDVAGANGAGLISVWLDRSGKGRQQGDPVATFNVTSLEAVQGLWRSRP